MNYKEQIVKMLRIKKFRGQKQKLRYRRKARLMFELLYYAEIRGEDVKDLRHKLNTWCRRMFN